MEVDIQDIPAIAAAIGHVAAHLLGQQKPQAAHRPIGDIQKRDFLRVHQTIAHFKISVKLKVLSEFRVELYWRYRHCLSGGSRKCGAYAELGVSGGRLMVSPDHAPVVTRCPSW